MGLPSYRHRLIRFSVHLLLRPPIQAIVVNGNASLGFACDLKGERNTYDFGLCPSHWAG